MSSQSILTNISISSKPFMCDEDEDDMLVTRFDDEDANEESLCESTRKTIMPKLLPSTLDDKEVNVLNTKEFVQYVTIETCMLVSCAFLFSIKNTIP